MPRVESEFGCDPKRMPFDFSDVLAVIAPRPIFINAPLRDENFDARGVDECVDIVRPLYRAMAERLQVRHPDRTRLPGRDPRGGLAVSGRHDFHEDEMALKPADT